MGETLLQKVKQISPGSKDSTHRSYVRAIKRLFKLAGFETFPDNGGWLTNKKGAALRET